MKQMQVEDQLDLIGPRNNDVSAHQFQLKKTIYIKKSLFLNASIIFYRIITKG